ncbi:DUF397 domain-containing protein [Kitasatospora sp. NPDC056531]|uniref:DUF397 domain-containing protein n=1 Tax=Kitasatospora sp. NPDC056531 TaxID=3345856 RepID=UPI0036981BC6
MTMPKISARGWYKSSYSAQATDCVETGPIAAGGMAVRDSKDPGGPVLVFPADTWSTFVSAINAGDIPSA